MIENMFVMLVLLIGLIFLLAITDFIIFVFFTKEKFVVSKTAIGRDYANYFRNKKAKAKNA
jgi:hypothetical protein